MTQTGKYSDRSAARLAAVQALYQIDMTNATVASVIDEFGRYRLKESERQGNPDPALFKELVKGVHDRQEELDERLRGLLIDGWSIERLGATLRAIVRSGCYELQFGLDVPAQVIVSEYVDIAHGFYDEKETNFVNAVLDGLAKAPRLSELSTSPADGPKDDEPAK